MEPTASELLELVSLYPKNYQLWQFIHAKVTDFSLKASILSKAIEYDSKNYHAWEVLIGTPSLLDFGDTLSKTVLENDKENNSAKNYRLVNDLMIVT